MEKLRTLSVGVLPLNDGRDPRVAIHVDGRSLVDLVREAELPHAALEGVPALAGNYGWPRLTSRLTKWLSGQGPAHRRDVDVLLNCDCGMPDCWPLSMQVCHHARVVTWQAFVQGRRQEGWNYSMLAPLRFPRAAYDAEIARLCAARLVIASRSPSRVHPLHRDESVSESCAL